MSGIQLLLQSHRYAQNVGCSPWEFAVEIGELKGSGMSHGDLRWLICRGLVAHGHEVRRHGEARREFQLSETLELEATTCFCLTTAGVAVALRHTPKVDPLTGPAVRVPYTTLQSGISTPHWDGNRHCLVLGDSVIKEFRVPSPNQEAVLAALQEEGWPVRIDDPLPQVVHIDPKRRLHDTIKSLNRNQRPHLISFQGDGTGEGVRWGLLCASGPVHLNGHSREPEAGRVG